MRHRRVTTTPTEPNVLGIVATVSSGESNRVSWRVQNGFNRLFNWSRGHDWLRRIKNPIVIDLTRSDTHILALVCGSIEQAYLELGVDPDDATDIFYNGFGVTNPDSEEGRRDLLALSHAWRLAVIQQQDALFASTGRFPDHTRN